MYIGLGFSRLFLVCFYNENQGIQLPSGRAGAKRSRGPGFKTALATLKSQKPGFESLLDAPILCFIARPTFLLFMDPGE